MEWKIFTVNGIEMVKTAGDNCLIFIKTGALLSKRLNAITGNDNYSLFNFQ